MILLLLAGALSMVAQVVVLRELVAALFGVELLYVLALGAWLLGTAAGSIAGRRVRDGGHAVAAGFLTLGLFVPAVLVFVRAFAGILGAVPGAYLAFPLQALLVACAAVPPAFVCGFLFPPLAGSIGGLGAGISRGYAIEGAGAAAGGVLVTVAMGLGASTLVVALTAGALALAAAAAAGFRLRAISVASILGISAAWSLGVLQSGAWDAHLTRWTYPALVAVADTPYARVAVSRSEGQVAVFVNGALAFESEGTTAEAFADIAAAQHPRPRRALVLGGGGEGVPAALRAHAIPEIDNVEIDEQAFRLVTAHAPAPRAAGRDGAGLRVIFAEPRRRLARSQPYDLILVATGDPASGAASRFYTREFFRICARSLTQGGVLAVRLAASENVWPRPLARRTASIVNALRAEFPEVDLVPGATLFLFASKGPLTQDPAVLSGRLGDRGVQSRIMTPRYVRYLYENDRRDQVRQELDVLSQVEANRDAAPSCYQYAATQWLSMFYPSLAVAPPIGPLSAWVVGLAVAATVGVWLARGRGRPDRRLTAMLFVAGLVGMVLETVLILQYQVAHGTVFQHVGWLLTCFMAGLAAGGWFFSRGAASGTGGPKSGRMGRIPAAALAAAAACAAMSTRMPAMAGLGWTSLMLAASGLIVGGCVALAAARWSGSRREGASSIYAADVAGGAAGAVLATLVFVPAAGLDGACLISGAIAAILILV